MENTFEFKKLLNKVSSNLDRWILEILNKGRHFSKPVSIFTNDELSILGKYFEKYHIEILISDGQFMLIRNTTVGEKAIKEKADEIYHKLEKIALINREKKNNKGEEGLRVKTSFNFDLYMEKFEKTGKSVVFPHCRLTNNELNELNTYLSDYGVILVRGSAAFALAPHKNRNKDGYIDGIYFKKLNNIEMNDPAELKKLENLASLNFEKHLNNFLNNNLNIWFPAERMSPLELATLNILCSKKYGIILEESKNRLKFTKVSIIDKNNALAEKFSAMQQNINKPNNGIVK